VQRWLVHLLSLYSDAYASNQFRALQQFFRWLAEEEQVPDPGDLMELNGWSFPQMLPRYGASARSARARRTYDRIMAGSP